MGHSVLVTLSIIDTQNNNALPSDCHYVKCLVLFITLLNVNMLSVVKLSVVMLSVVMLNVIMLSVMARLK
jgi:hypothetical protein